MSLPTRACLAMALGLAGGFGLPGPPGYELLGLALMIALGVWLAPREQLAASAPNRMRDVVTALALALVLGLLARTLGRVVIATPSALWSIPVAGIALWSRARDQARLWLPPAIVALSVLAGLAGAEFEARGPQPRGRVDSSPILGVHPRQATAVSIDGFGPHDLVVDDFVDPPGGQGYDPQRFATRLEAELRAIAENHYADGPARARAAFSGAEVEVRESLVPPSDRGLYSSLLGVEVRSGTTGEGSTVEFGCPGQPLDPRGATVSGAGSRVFTPGSLLKVCPRKYLVDGSTGLGLAARFPGYTTVIGRDRVRLASWFGWPTGDSEADRRALALESGAWLLGLLVVAWVFARRHDRPASTAAAGVVAWVLAAASILAVLGTRASADVGGPAALAILLVLVPTDRRELGSALPFALLIAVLAAAPLAGHGSAVELVAVARDGLADLGLGFATAATIAASLATVALAVGAGICASALVDRSRSIFDDPSSERRHTGWFALALALVVGLGLALRKPEDDVPLLVGGTALVLLGVAQVTTPARQLTLTLICTAAAAAPVLEAELHSPISAALVALTALLCPALALARFRSD